MLLNTEELLALINGDVEPDRLADLLDRLEHCPDSAAALQTLVTLRANREEALEALRTAPDSAVIPHPATRRVAVPAWTRNGLRVAAAVALVAMIGVWAVSTPVSSILTPTDATHLATELRHRRNAEAAEVHEDGVRRAAELLVKLVDQGLFVCSIHRYLTWAESPAARSPGATRLCGSPALDRT